MSGRKAISPAAAPQRIGIGTLEQRLNAERSTIWRWYRAGKFPVPHYLGVRRCWWLHEIEDWEAAQMARVDQRLASDGMIGASRADALKQRVSK